MQSFLQLKKNIMNVKSHFSKYGKIIESLRQEVSEISVVFVNTAITSSLAYFVICRFPIKE